jgi:predicted nuclease of predicted toxin-antitoxin system
MALFYADENFDYGVVRRLRAAGHDELTVQEAGEQGRDDTRVLGRAILEGRCVLTFDRADFKRLHRQCTSHSGIISCTRDNDADALASRIEQACINAGTLAGQLITVTRPQHTP